MLNAHKNILKERKRKKEKRKRGRKRSEQPHKKGMDEKFPQLLIDSTLEDCCSLFSYGEIRGTFKHFLKRCILFSFSFSFSWEREREKNIDLREKQRLPPACVLTGTQTGDLWPFGYRMWLQLSHASQGRLFNILRWNAYIALHLLWERKDAFRSFFFQPWPEDMFTDSRERGMEREREESMWEKHWLVASHTRPIWGLNLQPTYVPWPEIELATLWCTNDAPTSWANWPGHFSILFKLLSWGRMCFPLLIG